MRTGATAFAKATAVRSAGRRRLVRERHSACLHQFLLPFLHSLLGIRRRIALGSQGLSVSIPRIIDADISNRGQKVGDDAP